MANLTYEIFADYDVLRSNSKRALLGKVAGWCRPEKVDEDPLTFVLFAGVPDVQVGRIEIEKLDGGMCRINFYEYYDFSLEQDEREKRNNSFSRIRANYLLYLEKEGFIHKVPSTKKQKKVSKNSKPGRHYDPWNLTAYAILIDGKDNAKERAYDHWLDRRGINPSTALDRAAFDKAMKRQEANEK